MQMILILTHQNVGNTLVLILYKLMLLFLEPVPIYNYSANLPEMV